VQQGLENERQSCRDVKREEKKIFNKFPNFLPTLPLTLTFSNYEVDGGRDTARGMAVDTIRVCPVWVRNVPSNAVSGAKK
jgi:hypothetical protein